MAELDRLVTADPENLGYRLALARNLLRRGETTRARFHLRQARAAPGLTAHDRATLVRILSRLETAKTREGWLRFALSPESNPGQRSASHTIDINGLTWQLDDAARAKPATGIAVGFGGALMPEIAPGLKLRLGAAIDAKLYEDQSLNDVFLRTEVGFQGLSLRGVNWRAGLTGTLRHAGGNSHGRALGLQAERDHSLGTASHLRLRAEIEWWRHDRHIDQDSTRATASAMLIHAWRPDLLLRSGVYLHRNAARADWESAWAAGLSLGVQRAFQSGLVIGIDAAHSQMRREGPTPLFGRLRKETRNSLGARLLHRQITVKGFAPALELGFERQKSTVSLHDYRNLRMSLGFTREF